MAKKITLDPVLSICVEDVPKKYEDEVWENLDKNGGNVMTVQADSDFGRFLVRQGYEFDGHDKSWGWLVVFR